MTGRKKKGGKKQTKQNKKNNDKARERVVQNDNAPSVSDAGNDTDHMSATSQECQPLPPDALYFKNTEYTMTCKIQSRCQVSNTVDFIKKFEPELRWFQNHPQFCHIFHMPDEQHLKLLDFWMLLLRTIPLDEGEDTSWFAVNGVPIRYSIRVHGLISGLDCHEYPDNYETLGSYAFVDRHFQSHKEITMKSVEEKLSSMRACGDRLRMAVLYFLGTVIRAKGRWNSPFDSFILRIVNDVELCLTFPWGRLTFDDNIRSINYIMKRLKGKAKKNVNFPGFIVPLQMLAFECIPSLNARFREHEAGCMSDCPRMCKWRFVSNSMKGFPLEDLYDALGNTKEIKSILVPTVDEETLMARIVEDEPDYENEDGPSNLWSTWLTVKQKPIWWKDLYELDVAAREFPEKKDKRKVHEEASSSNSSLADILKGFEERLMTGLSEVNGKVDKMNKRLVKIKACQVVLKKRCKKMKAMENFYLKKKAKMVETFEGRIDRIEQGMKEMKEKEKDNYEGFDYQGMDYEWGGQRNDSNGVDTTPEKADIVELEGQRDHGQKIDEKESEEEAHKEGRGSEEENEAEAEESEEGRGSEEEKEPEKEPDEIHGQKIDEKESEEEAHKEGRGSEEENEAEAEESEEGRGSEEEKEPEAEEDKEKEKEDEDAEKEKILEKEPDEIQEEVEMNEANEVRVEVETEKTEARVEVQTEKTEARLSTPPRGRTKAEAARRALHTTPKKLFTLSQKLQKRVVEEAEAGAEEMVEDKVEEPEKEATKYTKEEKQEWVMVVYETKEADKGAVKPAGTEGVPAVDKTDGTQGVPARTGVKHRPKQMALRQHVPKPRGRPRKTTEPKKFTTPEQTKRTRSRSQWVSSPFTEADTDEIEGRKKKPRTKA